MRGVAGIKLILWILSILKGCMVSWGLKVFRFKCTCIMQINNYKQTSSIVLHFTHVLVFISTYTYMAFRILLYAPGSRSTMYAANYLFLEYNIV